jgi:diaminohydroxyphosphoribosylaminopyrimidine deaminase/5-amino-6-(5-phosphoribosylamino)uracil reductase
VERAGDLTGATVYVTLEPCAHESTRGTACSDLLARLKPGRVVVGTIDPDPRTSGRGIARMRAAGVAVDVGVAEAQCRELIRGFHSRITRGRPWITLKVAASLDGRTATATGESQWITGQPARQDVHRLRRAACAVLTGIGTVRSDNPRLTVRHVPCERQPARIVIDHALDLSSGHAIADTALAATHVLTLSEDSCRALELAKRGIKVHRIDEQPGKPGKVDLVAAAARLGSLGFNDVLAETGAKLAGSLIAAGVVDELVAYLAPSALGDAGLGMFALPGLAALEDRVLLKFTEARQVGPDIRLRARLGVR